MQLSAWGQAWYNGPTEIDVSSSVPLNGLATSEDIKTYQDAANAKAEADSKIVTDWKDLLADVQEALLGIPADIMGQTERRSLRDILMHENRLRGLGVLLVTLAIMGAVVGWLLRLD